MSLTILLSQHHLKPIVSSSPTLSTEQTHCCAIPLLASAMLSSSHPDSSSRRQLASSSKAPSLLNVPLEIAPFKKLESFWQESSLTSARLLGHIVGDRFIKQSGLEGSQVRHTSRAMLQLFKLMEKQLDDLTPLIEQITPRLEQLIRFDEELDETKQDRSYEALRELAERWSQRARQLKAGEYLLLPGGYTALFGSGHGMVYKIQREADSSFSLTLYNRGEGACLLAALGKEGIALKAPFCQRFVRLSEEQLQTSQERTGEGLLLTLLEPLYLPLISLSSYSGESLYTAVVQRLFGPASASSPDLADPRPSDFHTLQKAGNCAWKSLLALLRDLVPDRESYKQLVTALKLYATMASYQSVEPLLLSDLRKADATVQFLQEATRELIAHSAARLWRQSHMSGECPAIYRKAQTTGIELQQKLQKLSNTLLELQQQPIVHLPRVSSEERSQLLAPLLRPLDQPKVSYRSAQPIATPSALPIAQLASLPLPQRLDQIAKWLKGLATSTVQKDAYAAYHLVSSCLRDKLLPLPWLGASEASAWPSFSNALCLSHLKTLLAYFTQTQSEIIDASRTHASYLAIALFSICDYLACQINPDLRSYPMIDLLHQHALDSYEIILDPFTLQLSQALSLYVAQRNGLPQEQRSLRSPLFQLPIGKGTILIEITPESKHSETHLLFQQLVKTVQPSDLAKQVRTLLTQPCKPDEPNPCYHQHQLDYLYDLRNSALLCQTYTALKSVDHSLMGNHLLAFNIHLAQNKHAPQLGNLSVYCSRSEPIFLLKSPKLAYDSHTEPNSFGLQVIDPFFLRLSRSDSDGSIEAEAYRSAQRDPSVVALLKRSQSSELNRPYDLLAQVEPRMLEEVKWQSLFQLVLFKTTYQPGNGLSSALFKELNAQQELLKRATEFIQRGFRYSIDCQSRPNTQLSLFYIRISYLLAYSALNHTHLAPTDLFPLLERSQQVFRSLQSHELPLQERLEWHLLGILAGLLDLHGFDFTLTSYHWLAFHDLKSRVGYRQRSPWLENLISAFYVERLNRESLDPQKIAQILKKQLPSIDLEGFDRYTQHPHSHTYCLSNSQGFQWQLNLSLGLICSSEGQIKSGGAPGLLYSTLMEKLCGPTVPEYCWSGTTLLVKHPLHSQIDLRIREENLLALGGEDWTERLVLMRKGRELHYLPSTALVRALPSTFLAGHLLFADRQTKEVWVFERHSMEQVGHMDADGKLIITGRTDTPYLLTRFRPPLLSASSQLYLPPHQPELDLLDLSSEEWQAQSAQLEQFEKIDYIEHWTLESASSSVATERILFPRMSRAQGGVCSFTQREGKLWYDLDPEFYLVPKQLLGNLHTKLTLFNPKKQSYLVLVPALLTPKKDSEELSEAKDFNRFLRWEIPEEQDLDRGHCQQIRFFEYHTQDDGELFGTLPESELWLAALWLAQREYEHCIKILQRLETSRLDRQTRTLSRVDLCLLELLHYFNQYGDRRPDSSACLIHLVSKTLPNLRRLEKHKDRIDNPIPKEYIKDIYEHYLKTTGHSRTQFRCPEELEFGLCQWLESDAAQSSVHVAARLKELQGKALKGFSQSARLMKRTLELPVPGEIPPVTFDTFPVSIALSPSHGTPFGQVDREHLELLHSALTHDPQERHRLHAFAHQRLAATAPKKNLTQLEEAERTQADRSANYRLFLRVLYAMTHPDLPPEQLKEVKSWVSELKLKKPLNLMKYDEKNLVLKKFNDIVRGLFHWVQKLDPRYTKVETHEVDESSRHSSADSLPSNKLFANTTLYQRQHAQPIPLKPIALQEGLEDLVAKYIEERPAPHDRPVELQLKSDLTLQNALEYEKRAISADLKEGRKQLASGERYSPRLSELPHLQKELTLRKEQLSQQADRIKDSWLELLNRSASEPLKAEAIDSVKSAGLRLELDEREGCLLLLRNDRHTYLRANPYLSQAQIEECHNLGAQWLALMTQQQHLERCLKSTQQCLELGAASSEALKQQLCNQLKARRTYQPHLQPILLLFEYYAKLRIHSAQMKLLQALGETREGSYQDSLVQLIMGGGKTSVLATILGTQAAKPGRFSLFITPASQFESVKKNLSLSLHRCFDQQLQVFDFERHDLQIDFLKQLLADIDRCMQFGHMAISKPECFQALELEFISLLEDLSLELPTEGGRSERLQLLGQILLLLKEQTDLLADEVDLVLHPLFEVNFPRGAASTIAPSHVELMLQIYRIMLSPNCYLGSGRSQVSIRQWLGLVDNQQERNFSKERFLQEALPAIAQALAHRCFALKLQAGGTDYTEAFVDYCSCTLDLHGNYPIDQKRQQRVIEYMQRLDQLSRSQDADDQQAADLAALAKCILRAVLPVTLARSGGRHYGRGHTGPAGKVVPYTGVDTPATTEFGFYLEAVAYHIQTVLQFGIEEEQLAHLAKELFAQAAAQAHSKGVKIGETKVAQSFYNLTGLTLEQTQDPLKIKDATARINAGRLEQQYEPLLLIEGDTAIVCQTYHLSRVSSNAHSLKQMFNTFRGFSGTPWNMHTYPLSLQKRFIPDQGSEGKVFHALLKKEELVTKGRGAIVHVVEAIDRPLELLKTTLQGAQAIERFGGLMDPAGVFKSLSNRQVAEQIKRWMLQHKPSCQGVLYFKRQQPSQSDDSSGPAADLLALLRRDAEEPEELSGTSRDELARYGLEPGNYLVYYDERHTTGTDIAQAEDAINLMTYDETLGSRSMAQSIMRLRQFLFGQSVEIVLSKSTAYKVGLDPLGKEQVKRLLEHAIVVQTRQKVQVSSRGLKQMIEEEFRQFSRQLLLEQTAQLAQGEDPQIKQALIASYRELRSFLVQELSDSPFRSYGALEQQRETRVSLQARSDRLMAQARAFVKAHPSAELSSRLDQLNERVKAILNHHSPLLPKTEAEQVGHSGIEQEVEVQQEQQVEVQQEQEVELELLQELEQYRLQGGNDFRTVAQITWSEHELKELVAYARGSDLAAAYHGHELPPAVRAADKSSWSRLESSWSHLEREPLVGCVPLQQFIKQTTQLYHAQGNSSVVDFSSIFSLELLATFNFLYPYNHRLLPLDPRFLRPEQMLLVRGADNSFRLIWITRAEEETIKRWLRKNSPSDLWLINSHGTLNEDAHQPIDRSDPALQSLLTQVHAFLGRIDLLEANPSRLKEWLDRDQRLKQRFLKLRAASDPYQYRLWKANPLLNPESQSEGPRFLAEQTALDHPLSQLSPKQIQKLSKEELEELAQRAPQKLGSVTPAQAAQLHIDRVRYLKSSAQIATLSQEQFAGLTPEQVPLLTDRWQIEWLGTRTSHLQQLTAEQLLHVSAGQMGHLSRSQVRLLTQLEQFKALKFYQLPYLQRSQLDSLSEQEREILLIHLVKQMPQPISSSSLQPAPNLLAELIDERGIVQGRVEQLEQERLQKLSAQELWPVTGSALAQLAQREFARHLSDQQLQCLSDRELIQAIPNDRLEQILQKEQIPHLSPGQIAQLTRPCHIEALAPNQLPHLGPDGFKHLNEAQKAALLDKEILLQLQEWQLQSLPPFAIPPELYLEHPRLLHSLSEMQLQCCGDEMLKIIERIQEPALLAKLSSRQISQLNDTSFGRLPFDRKLQLSQEALLARPAKLLGSSAEELNRLAERHPVVINHLLPEQVAQVQADCVVAVVNQEQSNHLHPSLLKRLGLTRQWQLDLAAQRRLPASRKLPLTVIYLVKGLYQWSKLLVMSYFMLPWIFLARARVRSTLGEQYRKAAKLSWSLRLWV